jgi:tetratricopeptide (TPR) repeat protein
MIGGSEVKKIVNDRLFMENRTKLDSAEPAVQFNFEQGSTKSVQTKDALRVNQQSTTGHSLSAERYYEAGRRLEDENCENEAIKYFQKSLACIPNNLGITPEYSRYLFAGQQPRIYKDDFVSEIYEGLSRCLFLQKRIEDAWFAENNAKNFGGSNNPLLTIFRTRLGISGSGN